MVGVMMPSYARYALDDKLVADAFNPSPVVPDSAISLEAFFRFWMTPEQTDYVVREVGGKPAGILSLKKVREISTDKWNETSLSSLMAPRFPTAHPNEPIDDALVKMVERGLTAAPVVDEHSGELLGELTARNVYSLLLGVQRAKLGVVAVENGGEGGIRTHDTQGVYRFSRAAPSTTRPPLRMSGL